MLNIKCFQVNMVEENCYVVSDHTKQAVIIDDGALYAEEHEAIDRYIRNEGLELKESLCTHGHFDHTFGLGHIYQTYWLRPRIHTLDARLYTQLNRLVEMMRGTTMVLDVAPLGPALGEGDIVTFGETTLQVMCTPGHTPGGVCFYCAAESVLFSGDSLFQLSIGRTDFPGGSYDSLIGALKEKVMVLPADTRVYPGHGSTTTIGYEAMHNPYVS